MSQRTINLCGWHDTGVPLWAAGFNWRDRDCPVCAKKLAAGLVTADAPTPREYQKAVRRAMWERRLDAFRSRMWQVAGGYV